MTEVSGGQLRQFQWQPADFGLEPAGRETMLVDGPGESAAMIRAILAGRGGPPRDIVVANAAAALWTAGRSSRLAGVRPAGPAGHRFRRRRRDLLQRLAERTN